MDNKLQKTEKYQLMIEQIKAAITEAIHNSRWDLIVGYWSVGKLIREDADPKEDKFTTQLLQGIAVDVGVSERTLWYALKAYDTYPELDTIPEGKNISWTKLTTKYLTEGNQEEKTKTPVIDNHVICPMCGYKFDITKNEMKAVERG